MSEHIQVYNPIGGQPYCTAPTPKTSDGSIDVSDSSNKIATTEWVNEGYLPLSGGTITGMLKTASINILPENNNKEGGQIELLPSIDSVDSHRSIIDNFDHQQTRIFSHYNGTSGIGSIFALDHKNGTMYWNNHIVTHVIDTWSNGVFWYRKWSEGWIEQGGQIEGVSTNTAVSVNFVIPFTTTNYYISIPTLSYGSALADAAPWYSIAVNFTASTTSFGTVALAYPRRWYACGY